MTGARLAVALVTTAAACAPPAEVPDLAGTYVLSIQADTLRLESTGRYTRVNAHIGAHGRAAIDSGRWRVSNNRRMVALSNLSSRWPEHGRFDPKAGTWHLPDTTVRRTVALVIGRTWKGDVVLDVNPALGWRYRRLRDEQ